jgi:hypothetical protein
VLHTHAAQPRSLVHLTWEGGSMMSDNQIPPNRAVWLAIIFIMSVLVSAGAGFVLHLAKASPADMLSASGGAFVATMTLGMAAARFISG